jgi:hypothetical protein
MPFETTEIKIFMVTVVRSALYLDDAGVQMAAVILVLLAFAASFSDETEIMFHGLAAFFFSNQDSDLTAIFL